MSDIDLAPVNVGKVAREAKAAGQFILFSRGGDNFIMTAAFMLRLRRYDAFLLKCKLEIEQGGLWYEKTKAGIVAAARKPEPAKYAAQYATWINKAANDAPLVNTGLTVNEYNGFPCEARLFAGAGGYVALRGGYLDMLEAAKDFRRAAGSVVVVDGAQVLAPMNDQIWETNSFIVRLKGEKENAE